METIREPLIGRWSVSGQLCAANDAEVYINFIFLGDCGRYPLDTIQFSVALHWLRAIPDVRSKFYSF